MASQSSMRHKTYAIGGEVLPDIISGVGDIVGAIFGDYAAGDQAVGVLSNLDGGRTKGAGVETQLLGMASGKNDSEIQAGSTGTPGTGLNAAFNPGETNASGKFTGGIGQEAGNGAGLASMFFEKGGVPRRKLDVGGNAGSTPSSDDSAVHMSGLFNSSGAGRTDIHNRDVPANGFVVPADVTSGLGQGNTMSGSSVIDRMMGAGPYGVKPGTGPEGIKLDGHGGHASFPKLQQARPARMPQEQGIAPETDAKGGITGGKKNELVPVVVAGGEHYINPADIERKFGSLDRGHKILRQWVISRRAKNIKELKKLPEPKK